MAAVGCDEVQLLIAMDRPRSAASSGQARCGRTRATQPTHSKPTPTGGDAALHDAATRTQT